MSESLSDSGDECTLIVVQVDYVGYVYHQVTRTRVYRLPERSPPEYIYPVESYWVRKDEFRFTPTLSSWGIIHIDDQTRVLTDPSGMVCRHTETYNAHIHDYMPLGELVPYMIGVLKVIHPDLVNIIIGYVFDLSFVPKNVLKTQ